jgi:membrane protein involved in D-alanine export
VTPYVDFTYFLLIAAPLLALVVLGALGRLGRSTVLAVSLAVVLFQYGRGAPAELAFLAAYAASSVAVVLGYATLRRRGAGDWTFRGAIALALLPLVAVKIAPVGGAGFLGLSYMSLRAVDALIALRDRVVADVPSAGDLVAYLLFVPTISAGPIDRFHRFRKDLRALPRGGSEYLRHVEAGIHRIAQGFLYKFIVAHLIQKWALRPLGTRAGVGATIEYMYAYSLYLFFDFAGYSAFAIGVGHFFGIEVPENFNAPWRSRNFREMWDRWHITLSWWLRDHVYMRFMRQATRRKWFGGNRQRAHVAGLMLTMGLMGCWHGLRPQYVLYGLYQGAMLVAYDLAGRWNARRRLVADGPLARAAGVFVTANLFCFGLLIFSGRLFAHGGEQRLGGRVVAERLAHVDEAVDVTGREHEAAAELHRILAELVLAMPAPLRAPARDAVVLAEQVEERRAPEPRGAVRPSLLVDEKREVDAGLVAEGARVHAVTEPDRDETRPGPPEILLELAQLRDVLAAEDSAVVAEEDDDGRPGLPQRPEPHLAAVGLGKDDIGEGCGDAHAASRTRLATASARGMRGE